MNEIKTDFDATLLYGVDDVTGLEGLIIESRGGTKKSKNYRNPSHSKILSFVLEEIRSAEVFDLEIYVAAKNDSYPTVDSRKILYENNRIIDMSTIIDFKDFLRSIKKSIRTAGQLPMAKGGNSTKRLLVMSKSTNLESLFYNNIKISATTENESELEYIYQRVKKRLRQSKFRKELLEAYDNTCAVTGSKVIELLEAAHIQPYNGAHTSVISNGILLRSDIHDLFDIYVEGKRLINISVNYKIEVHSSLEGSEYWDYNGKEIKLPNEKKDHPKFL